jgi:hypothetical protein
MVTGIALSATSYEPGRRPSPEGADAFAEAVILTICSASVTPAVGLRTFERCMRALGCGGTARMGFRHPTKADAIDRIWCERHRFYRDYQASANKRVFLEARPGIGPVTKRSLSERLGLVDDTAPANQAA